MQTEVNKIIEISHLISVLKAPTATAAKGNANRNMLLNDELIPHLHCYKNTMQVKYQQSRC